MNVKIISKDILLISNFITDNSIKELIFYINNISVESKNTDIYRCYTYKLKEIDFNYISKFFSFSKLNLLINRVFDKNYQMTDIGEIVKMSNGDFLALHTDSFHKIQGVLYLSDINKNNGGEFYINDKKYYPNSGDIVIFNGNIPHKVLTVKNNSRISITFGFK